MTFLEIADPAVAANELLELFPKVPAVRGGLPMGKCVISRTAIFFYCGEMQRDFHHLKDYKHGF